MNAYQNTWFVKAADSVLKRTTVRTDRWYYSYGLVFKGMEAACRKTGDARYRRFVKRYYDAFVGEDGSIHGVDPLDYNLDNVNNGKMLFPLFRATGDRRYQKAAELLKGQLDGQPRTSEGAFWHKHIYPYQIWLDGLYMAGPFYAEYLQLFEKSPDFSDVVRQFSIAYRHTRDERTGLLYHAWDEKHIQPWCDPETGRSLCFWGRSIGWFVMAIVDVLDYLPAGLPGRPELIRMLRETLEALERVRDPASGVFYQIQGQGGRPGNYRESSASCMICYAMAKGTRMGYLAPEWGRKAAGLFRCIVREFVAVAENGLVNVHKICTGAGLGGWRRRSGSFEYYISEPIVTNHPHGLGSFILAGSEVETARPDSQGTAGKPA